eukprot:ANDGO_00462.mRNA.1 UPF0769 protein CG18675
MVLLHVKRNERDLFLYETASGVSMDSLSTTIAALVNDIGRLERLKDHCEDLIAHGPIKSVEELDSLHMKELSLEEVKDAEQGGKDPLGHRIEAPLGEHQANVLRNACRDALKNVGKENITYKICLTEKIVKDSFDLVRGAVAICFPAGLPEHDPVMEAIADKEHLDGQVAKDVLEPSSAMLWWAGKQLLREKTLADFVGKNEKTKVLVKIAKKGSGPPAREPQIDPQAQKEMMAYYYKKQEEAKKMAEEAEDAAATSNAPWADPKALKKAFSGTGGIRL